MEITDAVRVSRDDAPGWTSGEDIMVYTVVEWSLKNVDVAYQVVHQDDHVAAIMFGSRHRPRSIESAKLQAHTLCSLLNICAIVPSEAKRRAGSP